MNEQLQLLQMAEKKIKIDSAVEKYYNLIITYQKTLKEKSLICMNMLQQTLLANEVGISNSNCIIENPDFELISKIIIKLNKLINLLYFHLAYALECTGENVYFYYKYSNVYH